jgi:hypothetical protein
MPSLVAEIEEMVKATSAHVSDDTITVELEDGRTISFPTAWYPRLQHATGKERANYQIDRVGISWPDVEADFSIRGILLGRKSGESPESFKFWLDNRKKGRKVSVEQWLNLGRHAKRRPIRPARRSTKKVK